MIKITMRNGNRVTLDLLGDVARIEVGDAVLIFERGDPVHPAGVDLAMPIRGADLLSVRAQNCLDNAGIKTLGDLLQKREVDLWKLKNMGRKSTREVVTWLGSMGLSLRE